MVRFRAALADAPPSVTAATPTLKAIVPQPEVG
ncbi:hypothetical protein ACUW9K_002046 [Corynebacterium hesseae]